MPARGNAPGTCPRYLFRPARAEGIPAPLQGAPIDSETQGAALGCHAAAPSAPEPKLYKPEFRSFDGWPFMRWLLVTESCGRGFDTARRGARGKQSLLSFGGREVLAER